MSRLTLLFVAIILLIVGAAAGWTVRGFFAQDRCLDSGGAWDEALDSCSGAIVR
ncbi:hypothetical protein [Allosphingosinicella sp.]|jgi:hypothetical protein|uniref:hypothetical protein n=1 Tax=Allosphingosinicella sp. TaxID=2823234 RepID=UPI002F083581